jgi:hypothetical protein
VYPPLMPYVRGYSDGIGRSVQVFVELSYPSPIPPEHFKDEEQDAISEVFVPLDHRVGHVWFEAQGVGRKLLRAVHLRSYSFFLAFYDPSATQEEPRKFEREFLIRRPAAAILRASRASVRLVCNGMNAWESFYGSQENTFVSDN